jgi:acylphosphatase
MQEDEYADELMRAHVFCAGRVQGVGFRYFVLRKASALGVTGWVRNLGDGRVEAIFEGSPEAVAKAVEWCRIGPPHSHIRDLQVRNVTPRRDFHNFAIR